MSSISNAFAVDPLTVNVMTPPAEDSVTTGTTEVDFVAVVVLGAIVVAVVTGVFAATVVAGETVVAGATVVVGEALGIDLAPTWEIPSTDVTRTNPTEVMIFFTVVFLQTPPFNEARAFRSNTKNPAVVVMPDDSHESNFSFQFDVAMMIFICNPYEI
jgi:hypothetical protein